MGVWTWLKGLNWSRKRLEIVTVLLIVVFGATTFLVPLKSKTSLTYDGGKISYTGYVANYRMNGQGKLTFENGDVYEGDFVNGVFNGQGTFTAKTGWSYVGQFKNGQVDGQGKLTAKDKKVYQGTFKQGIYQK